MLKLMYAANCSLQTPEKAEAGAELKSANSGYEQLMGSRGFQGHHGPQGDKTYLDFAKKNEEPSLNYSWFPWVCKPKENTGD